MTDNFPQGWRVVAVPSNWDPTALELNIRPVTIRSKFLTLPEDFFMTIQTPEMIAKGQHTAVVATFRTTTTGVEIRHISGMGEGWIGFLDEILRELPAAEWEKHAEGKMAEFLRLFDEVRDSTGAVLQELPLWQLGTGPGASPAEVGVQRRRKITPEHLKEVARVYQSALANDDPPTRAVERHFAVSHSTAAKWVGAARRADLLPPHEG